MTKFTLTNDQVNELWEAADNSRASSATIKVPRAAFVAMLLHYQHHAGLEPKFIDTPANQQGVLI